MFKAQLMNQKPFHSFMSFCLIADEINLIKMKYFTPLLLLVAITHQSCISADKKSCSYDYKKILSHNFKIRISSIDSSARLVIFHGIDITTNKELDYDPRISWFALTKAYISTNDTLIKHAGSNIYYIKNKNKRVKFKLNCEPDSILGIQPVFERF